MHHAYAAYLAICIMDDRDGLSPVSLPAKQPSALGLPALLPLPFNFTAFVRTHTYACKEGIRI
jgi:hypothetical protein